MGTTGGFALPDTEAVPQGIGKVGELDDPIVDDWDDYDWDDYGRTELLWALDCGVCVLDLDVEDCPKIAQLSELTWEVSHSPPRLSLTVL